MAQKFSEYFELEEFLVASTARQKSIENVPSWEVVQNLRSLAQLLDWLRQDWGSGIRISSGFRCEKLNKAVGGVSNSAHKLKLKEILSIEREQNIKYINENLKQFSDEETIKNFTENIINVDAIDNIEEELLKFFRDINAKMDLLINKRQNTIMTMVNEMNNEFNILNKLINDNNLDLIGSNSDKADAIQDMLKIFLTKFNNEKKAKNDFEEKITKLIEELLDKMIMIKYNSNNS